MTYTDKLASYYIDEFYEKNKGGNYEAFLEEQVAALRAYDDSKEWQTFITENVGEDGFHFKGVIDLGLYFHCLDEKNPAKDFCDKLHEYFPYLLDEYEDDFIDLGQLMREMVLINMDEKFHAELRKEDFYDKGQIIADSSDFWHGNPHGFYFDCIDDDEAIEIFKKCVENLSSQGVEFNETTKRLLKEFDIEVDKQENITKTRKNK